MAGPHRERRGFGGDAHTSYQFGIATFPVGASHPRDSTADLNPPVVFAGAFFTKWARDFADVQGPDGLVANTAPTVSGAGGPAWAGFAITNPWQVYENFGDADLLREMYPTMTKCASNES